LALGLVACSDPPPVRDRPPPVATAPQATASASAAPAPFVPLRISLEQGAMGTRIVMTAYTSPEVDEEHAKRALAQAFREIERLEKLMSTWIPESEISRINDAAGKEAVVVGPETLAVIEKSVWIGKESKGTFDISFDSMRGLWKFDEGVDGSIPKKADIDKARKLIDYRKILIDPTARSVKLDRKGMRINLGGIAKGYAVDAAARVLEDAGLRGYFVQAGGDLFVRGRKPDGSRFRVGVRDPRGKGPNDHFAAIEIEDHAFSTAGDYERAFVKDGKRYHHIIDPRTGYPATACRSVTVWAKDAFLADALDDAIFILGPKEGLELVEAHEGAGAVIVDADNKVHVSKRLEGLVFIQRQPTDAP
jgi:thiamine biosynthesis lipoprotein